MRHNYIKEDMMAVNVSVFFNPDLAHDDLIKIGTTVTDFALDDIEVTLANFHALSLPQEQLIIPFSCKFLSSLLDRLPEDLAEHGVADHEGAAAYAETRQFIENIKRCYCLPPPGPEGGPDTSGPAPRPVESDMNLIFSAHIMDDQRNAIAESLRMVVGAGRDVRLNAIADAGQISDRLNSLGVNIIVVPSHDSIAPLLGRLPASLTSPGVTDDEVAAYAEMRQIIELLS
jgi:hypothetical protein